ncbi:hypothetical protein ACHQM5_023095 [Ranunculus cassubicifolius]
MLLILPLVSSASIYGKTRLFCKSQRWKLIDLMIQLVMGDLGLQQELHQFLDREDMRMCICVMVYIQCLILLRIKMESVLRF